MLARCRVECSEGITAAVCDQCCIADGALYMVGSNNFNLFPFMLSPYSNRTAYYFLGLLG